MKKANQTAWRSRYVSPGMKQGIRLMVHRVFLAKKSTTGEIVNTNWVLDYAMSPQGEYRAGSKMKSFQVRRIGTAHLYPPGLPYRERCTAEKEMMRESFYIIFEGAEQLDLSKFCRNEPGFAEFEDTDGTFAREMLCGLEETVSAPSVITGFFRAQQLLFRMAELLHSAQRVTRDSYLWQWAKNTTAEKSCSDALWLEKVTSYLNRSIARPFSLTQLSQYMKCSRSTLTHKYKQLTGSSLQKYQLLARIEMAKEMIGNHIPLKQIAADIGFCDEFHLSRTFTRIVGVTPSHFLSD